MWLSRAWFSLPIILGFLGVVFGNGPLIGLSVFLFAAGAIARYWALHAFDRLTYERYMPESRAFAGDRLSMTLRLANNKLLPLPLLEVRDAFPEGVLEDETHLVQAPFPNYVYLSRSTHLGWYERVSWPLEFDAPPRGYYRLGPARLNTGDIFGFFQETQEQELYDSIVIYPRIYTLPELGLPAQRPFGERRGRERIFEDPGRVAGLRDYRPGDALRRIDWKASARRQELQSKVYEPSSTLNLVIALNVHTLAHTWEGYIPELLERLLSAAGSVAKYAFDAGYAVGLIANGSYPASDRPMRIPPGSRPDQLSRILEALAVIGPLTLMPLETSLGREAQAFPFGSTLVCITARMEDSLAGTLRRIAGAGHTVTVLSLADNEDFYEQLGDRIRVFNISNAMRSLEVRARGADIEAETEAPA